MYNIVWRRGTWQCYSKTGGGGIATPQTNPSVGAYIYGIKSVSVKTKSKRQADIIPTSVIQGTGAYRNNNTVQLINKNIGCKKGWIVWIV